MPVDLTRNGRIKNLTTAVITLTQERNDLREQVRDVPTLHDELVVRDEQIEALKSQISVGDVFANGHGEHDALQQIINRKGRGALKIAEKAIKR